MRTYTAVIERDPDTGVFSLRARVPRAPTVRRTVSTSSTPTSPKVITMLLEDGEPPLEAELVGTQTILVA